MRHLIAAAALLAGAPALAEPPRYSIKMTLREGERVIGTPTIVVAADRHAHMSTADYSIAVLAGEARGEEITVDAVIALPVAGTMRQAANPTFRLKRGAPASIMIDHNTATGKPLLLTVEVSR